MSTTDATLTRHASSDNMQLHVTHTHEEYLTACTTLWGEAGAHVIEEFQRINLWLFDGTLPPLPFVICLTAYGKCVGATNPSGSWDRGDLPRITIASNLFRRGRNRVTDTIIHEMVHARLMLSGLYSKHAGDPWCDEITRLSPLVLGHEIRAKRVKTRRIDGHVVRAPLDGHLDHETISGWPSSLRDDSWDRGEPIEVETY